MGRNRWNKIDPEMIIVKDERWVYMVHYTIFSTFIMVEIFQNKK